MKIVFINNSQETFTPTRSGAIATWIWEVSREIRHQGIEPCIVSRSCEAAPYTEFEVSLLPYPESLAPGARRWLGRLERKLFSYTAIGLRRYAKRVVKAIRKESLDQYPLVLHNDLELAVILRQNFPSAVIHHHFHNQIDCKSRFLKTFLRSCSKITAVSDFTARWVEGRLGLEAGEIRTILNGVDCERFAPRAKVRRDLPVINFVGRTGMEKAPDLLLQAAIQIARRGLAFELQLIGSNHWDKFELDDYQRYLQNLVAELEQMGIRVRRPGHIARAALPGELNQADIHVVPSRWDEAFGLVTLEGMACGLATVASQTGGTPEVVGSAGLLFERDNVGALASHLEHLIVNIDARVELGLKARERAKVLSWQKTAQGLLEAGFGPANIEPKREAHEVGSQWAISKSMSI